MSAQNSFPRSGVIAAVVACFFALALGSSFAGTQKTFFQGTDLNDPNNYSPNGLPSNTSDVLLAAPSTALILSAATIDMESMNLTSDNASYTISNNTTGSTSSQINLRGFGNMVSPNGDDAIYLGGANSTLTFQGGNSGGGSGSLLLLASGNLNIAQATSTLNISAGLFAAVSNFINKTGAGTLNLSGTLGALGGGMIFSEGTSNILPGFNSNGSVDLRVTNANPGPGSIVNLNIQTSAEFRTLTGTVAGLSTQAVVNLAGAGTQLTIDQAGGSFDGTISGAGSVVIASGANLGQTFTGNNIYSGTTTVNDGALRIDGTTSGQGSYLISGILTGNGTIGLAANGTVTLKDGGGSTASRLEPGGNSAIGTLGVLTSGAGGVIFGDATVLTIDIGTAGASDLLAISGGYIDITSSSDTLILNSLSGAFDGSTYTIASFDQNLGGGTFNTVTGLPANYSVAYTPTSIMLRPVPEPGTIALVAELGGLLIFLKHYRKRKTAVRAPGITNGGV